MRIFVSYARIDKPGAERLVDRLIQIDHQPWVDESLTGGQSWWEEILRIISESDVILLVVTPAYLASEACRLERHYAARLNKTLVPVKIAPVSNSALPPDLSVIQHLDFVATDPNDESAALIRTLNRVPARRPLPVPLPVPPPAPLSYLSNLTERVSGSAGLAYNEQLDIVNRLDFALRSDDHDERQGGVALLSKLGRRRDLYADTARQIDRLNAAMTGPPQPVPAHPAFAQPSQPWLGHAAVGASANVPLPPWTQPPGPTGPRGTSTSVKVLAWIGAVMLILILLAAAGL